MDSEEHFVYLGQGIGDIKRRQGPVRLQVLKRPYNNGGVVWALVVLKDETDIEDGNVAAGVSTDFRDIEYGLSHCVQQCLAKEPLLAVVLSTINRFAPDEFQKAIPVTFTETEAQLTKGALDGKLNELVMFAALQLACRKDDGFPSTNTVRGFIEKLHEYLHTAAKEHREQLLEKFGNDFSAYQGNNKPSKDIKPIHKRNVLEGFNDGESFGGEGYDQKSHKGKLDRTNLPWLVPACSHEDLQNTHRVQQNLFTKDLNIAGLVLGTANSSFSDAKAYTWGNKLEEEWAFEFKCQAKYNLQKGCDDLVRKCQVTEGEDAENEEKDTIKCHAMLIGISGEFPSGCQWWVEKDEYLRVVLVVNNSPY